MTIYKNITYLGTAAHLAIGMDHLLLFAALLVIPTVFAGLEQCPDNLPHNSNLRLDGTHCYEFVLSHPVDWSHADQDCKLKGGYLVDIQSAAENYFIYKTLRALGYFNDAGVWIGLSDREKETTWLWTHRSVPVTFTNWAAGQPGLAGFFEDCAILQAADGKWHDYQCSGFLFTSEKHGWVCKYDASPPLPPASTMKPIVDGGSVNMMTSEIPVMATDSMAASVMAPMATDSMKASEMPPMATDSMAKETYTEQEILFATQTIG